MSARKGPGQAWWESHLNTIAREGIDTKAYARREGLPVSSLYYWRRRIKAQSQDQHTLVHNRQPPERQRLFVPVAMDANGGGDASRYVLALGPGLRLELSALPHPQWLAQVSHALSAQVR